MSMTSNQLAWLIRRHGIEMTHLSGGSHIGAILSVADIIAVLYADVLKYDPEGKDRWMMVGDFNAISRIDNPFLDRPDDDTAFLLHDYVRSATPYVDVIEHFYQGEYQPSTFSGRRIDFVYVTEPLLDEIGSARTITDGFATASRDPRGLSNFCNPSDHYPIAVTFSE